MSTHSRRDFLKMGSAGLLYGSAFLSNNAMFAQSLGLPLGLQLYSVRKTLPTDYEGTLKQIGALGYREVEAAGYYNHTEPQVKQAMKDAGLHCVSAHYSYNDLTAKFDDILSFNKNLGLQYIICSFPGFKDPSRLKSMTPAQRSNAFTMEDWRWNADQFNKIGEKVNAAGMKFGYHNHVMEFQAQDGVLPFIELLRLTDPSKVTMEMDCGWVIIGGGNPVELLHKYPTRISMLHVKDFKKYDRSASPPKMPVAAEMGQGSVDYRPIFEAAAKTGHVRHCFVEQEEFVDMPAMEALKVDAEYMRKLHA